MSAVRSETVSAVRVFPGKPESDNKSKARGYFDWETMGEDIYNALQKETPTS